MFLFAILHQFLRFFNVSALLGSVIGARILLSIGANIPMKLSGIIIPSGGFSV